MANSVAASYSCGDSGGVETTTKPHLSSTTEGVTCGQQPLPPETASLKQEAFNQKALAQLYHSSRRSRHFRRVSTSSAHAAYGKKLNQEKQLHDTTSHHHQLPAVEEEKNHTEPSADDVGWSFNIASLVDDCSSISSFGDESVIAVNDGGGIFHLESPDCRSRSTRKMEFSSTSGEPEGGEEGHGTCSCAEGRSRKRAKMTS